MTPPAPHRAAPLALLAAALLAACPLPQNLPDYPSTGTITPPRIQSDGAAPAATLLEVDPACAAAPAWALSATAAYDDTTKPFEARWFVDYLASGPRVAPQAQEIIAAPANGTDLVRPIRPWTFEPYLYDPGQSAAERQAFRDGGGLHVVELVVSNNFAPEPADPPHQRPNRTPAANFETQVFRWVFHYVPGGACGDAAP